MLVPIINAARGDGIFLKNAIFFSKDSHKNNIISEGIATYKASILIF